MSDDEDERASNASSESNEAADYQNHPRVYHVLRDFCDVPELSMQSSDTLLLPRHGSMKKAVLLATLYHVYLFKKKGLKLYTRWPARHLSICRRRESVYFSLGISADSVADTHQQVLRSGSSSSRRKKHDSDDDDEDEDENVDIDEDQEGSTFNACRIVCTSEASARTLFSDVNKVIYRAKSIADKHKREEEGKARKTRISFKEDQDKDSNDEDGSGGEDDSEDAPVDDDMELVVAKTSAAAAQASASTNMLHQAPGRYIAVASLVDGEFADYTALKNAYLRNEDGTLLEDLKTFIADQEMQVESMCRLHYPAFLHAAAQCATITSQDAETIRDELSGAVRLVRDAATGMKVAASSLLLSRGVRDHMVQASVLLDALLHVVELLETVETQVSKEQLLGAAVSLQEITRAAAGFSEYAVGEYILHTCVPRLRKRILALAHGQLNKWLALLRISAADVGRQTIEQLGQVHIASGCMARSTTVSDDNGGSWVLTTSFAPSRMPGAAAPAAAVPGVSSATTGVAAASTSGTGTLGDLMPKIAAGASVQRVFAILGLRDQFRAAYAGARSKQLQTDVLDPLVSLGGGSGLSPMEQLTRFCHAALGSLLLEDLVVHATRPFAVRSDTDLIALWDGICTRVSTMVVAFEGSLLHSETEALTLAAVKNVLALMNDMSRAVRTLVTSTFLNSLGLARVCEKLSNHLHSMWVQSCCSDTALAVSMDPLSPIPVKSQAEFYAYAGRFLLNRCAMHELPLPAAYRAGTLALPYALFVPTVGDRVIALIANCYSAHGGTEVNNFDDMMLEYLNVVLRTVHSMVQSRLQSLHRGSALQLALLTTSCAAMSIVISSAEMEFTVRCSYGQEGERGRQVLGSPVLLASSAQLFAQLTNSAIEKLNTDLQQEVTQLLQPMNLFSYWKARVTQRSGSGGSSAVPAVSSLGATCEFIKARVAPVKELLQASVFKSIVSFLWLFIVSTAQESIDSAVDVYHEDQNTTAMRNCVQEYRLEMREWIPKIRTQLDILAETSGSGGSASRTHVDYERTANEILKLIEAREMEIAEEKAKNLLLANLDAARAAGAAVVNGVADVGRATGKNIWKIGQTVKNGIANAGSTTPRASTDGGK